MLTACFSQTVHGMINALNKLSEQGRMPRSLRAENGPEFTCKALQIWAEKKGIVLEHDPLGKPTDNGHREGFYGKLREKCLSQHLFTSLDDAEQKIEARMQDYN